MTKFVECPVVINVPALETTLYIGHSYTTSFVGYLSQTGINLISGISENNSFGFESSKKCVFSFHLAPSKNLKFSKQ